jgi:hypothetical protein
MSDHDRLMALAWLVVLLLTTLDRALWLTDWLEARRARKAEADDRETGAMP